MLHFQPDLPKPSRTRASHLKVTAKANQPQPCPEPSSLCWLLAPLQGLMDSCTPACTETPRGDNSGSQNHTSLPLRGPRSILKVPEASPHHFFLAVTLSQRSAEEKPDEQLLLKSWDLSIVPLFLKILGIQISVFQLSAESWNGKTEQYLLIANIWRCESKLD